MEKASLELERDVDAVVEVLWKGMLSQHCASDPIVVASHDDLSQGGPLLEPLPGRDLRVVRRVSSGRAARVYLLLDASARVREPALAQPELCLLNSN